MKLVLFLGAGFSAAFGHPVMNDFFVFADASKRISDADREFLGKLILEARRANSFLESSPTNLEDILSFSEMGERLDLVSEAGKRSDRLKRLVAMIYTTPGPPEDFWRRYHKLEHFLGRKLSGAPWDISLITTNYDLNLECACRHMDCRASIGVPMTNIGPSGHLYGKNDIPLFKLHGSANWFAGETEESVKVDESMVKLQSGDVLPNVCTGQYKSADTPLIVPPSFLKPDLPVALRTIWSGAAKALSKAHVIAFVGYSFPSSDTEMMYFLARALSENATLRVVYVVDLHAMELVARLRAGGSKMGSHFRDLLHPIEGDWTKSKLPLMEP